MPKNYSQVTDSGIVSDVKKQGSEGGPIRVACQVLIHRIIVCQRTAWICRSIIKIDTSLMLGE